MLKVWHDIYILRIGRRKLKSCVKARIKTKKKLSSLRLAVHSFQDFCGDLLYAGMREFVVE